MDSEKQKSQSKELESTINLKKEKLKKSYLLVYYSENTV